MAEEDSLKLLMSGDACMSLKYKLLHPFGAHCGSGNGPRGAPQYFRFKKKKKQNQASIHIFKMLVKTIPLCTHRYSIVCRSESIYTFFVTPGVRAVGPWPVIQCQE